MTAARLDRKSTILPILLLTAAAPVLANEVPEAVQVPAGHRVIAETSGSGLITYACREKAGATGEFAWTFVGPDALLRDRDGKVVGFYFGPPATWAGMDGVRLTGTQLAVASNGKGNIPLQLVKTNPAQGEGAWQSVAYIQRLSTQGGTAPDKACSAANVGASEKVVYQADYLLWGTK